MDDDKRKIERTKLAIQTQLRMARALKEASHNALMEYLPEHMLSTLELHEIACNNEGQFQFQIDTLDTIANELDKET